MSSPPSIERVQKSIFSFRSDIKPSSLRQTHPSGILHALKCTKNRREEQHEHAFDRREEHAFAWIENIDHEIGVAWVRYMLVQYGFEDGTMKFIPYSSCENWVHRYPHACPYIECDANGFITGAPYFQHCISSSPATNISVYQQQQHSNNNDDGHARSRPTKRQKLSNKGSGNKLTPSATLFEAERSQLHVEIYKYMVWLYSTLIQIEKEGAPRTVRRTGISIPGLQNLLTKLEKTFKNVGEYKSAQDEKRKKKKNERESNDIDQADGDTGIDQEEEVEQAAGATPSLPMLEECFELELRRIADEAQQKEAQNKKSKQSEVQLRVVEEKIAQQQAVLERRELERMILRQQPMANCIPPMNTKTQSRSSGGDDDDGIPIKRARSSYVFFTQEERPKIQKEHPNIAFTDLGHAMGQRWRALSTEEKKKYEDLAEGDKKRYGDELAEYIIERDRVVNNSLPGVMPGVGDAAQKKAQEKEGTQPSQEKGQMDAQKNEEEEEQDGGKQQLDDEDEAEGGTDNDALDNAQDPIDFDNTQEDQKHSIEEEAYSQEQEHRDLASKVIADAANKENEQEGMLDFDAMVQRLLTYKKERGHIDVHHQYKDSDGIRLGRWVLRLRQRRRELRVSGLECEPPVEQGENADFVSLAVSQGRLGLSLTLQEVGALITAIDPACTFKDRIAVGDMLITIDGDVVRTVEDLAKGKEKKVRMFGIAKKVNHCSTYLSMERVERLEKIGFLWSSRVETPSKRAQAWDEKFQLLKQFKEEHGRWPKRTEKWNGLGDWIHIQRRAKTRKQKEFMKYRAPRLDEIGFPWQLKDSSKLILWEDHVQMLAEFYRVNRHFNVPHPQKSESDDISDKEKAELDEALKFHQWFSNLNVWYRAYKNGLKSTRLNEERINQLEDLGFEFNEVHSTTHARHRRKHIPDLPFEKRVEQLKEIEAEIGHINIDPWIDTRGNLGGWAAEMSKRYKKWNSGEEIISPELENQFNQLSTMGFEFNVSNEYPPRGTRSWDDLFGSLVEFIERFGHSKVPQKFKADVRLGTWVASQRQQYKLFVEGKHSKISQEQVDRLEAVNFIWDATVDGKRDRRQARLEAAECSDQRINYGMKHNDKCKMCYRKTKDSGLSSKERKKKCRSSRMGCAKCQEPICQECWDEGYDNPNHLK